VLVGIGYVLVGIAFPQPAAHLRAWRLAAWAVCGAAYAAHILYERVRLRQAPLPAAVHVALAVAIGAFGLAVSANIHSWSVDSTGSHRKLLLLSLGIWPVMSALPAFVVAFGTSVALKHVLTLSGVLFAVSTLGGQGVPPASEWTRADAATVRLAPSRFGDLPAAVRRELERRGCSIPQTYTAKAGRPDNVIRGHFISPTTTDWAVLCSRQRRSTLLVFRGGGVGKIDELAPGDDVGRLQDTGEGRIGYSRAIGVASPDDIREHNRNPTTPLPAILHEGIHDAFIEKGSVIWYWSDNRWLQLAGSDAPSLRR
jgi:hypothetical protein